MERPWSSTRRYSIQVLGFSGFLEGGGAGGLPHGAEAPPTGVEEKLASASFCAAAKAASVALGGGAGTGSASEPDAATGSALGSEAEELGVASLSNILEGSGAGIASRGIFRGVIEQALHF